MLYYVSQLFTTHMNSSHINEQFLQIVYVFTYIGSFHFVVKFLGCIFCFELSYQYQCKWLSGKNHLQNDLLHVVRAECKTQLAYIFWHLHSSVIFNPISKARPILKKVLSCPELFVIFSYIVYVSYSYFCLFGPIFPELKNFTDHGSRFYRLGAFVIALFWEQH